jgi:hypothetical protein
MDPALQVEYTRADLTDGWLQTGHGGSSTLVNLGDTPSGVPSWISDGAVTRALLQLKNEDVNLAADVYEWRQSVNLLTETVERIASTVRSFRRKSPKLWGQVIKNGIRNEWHGVPDEWIKLQYGWKPGMSDVLSSCSSLQTLDKAYDAKVVGVMTGQENDVTLRNSGFPFNPGENQTAIEYTTRWLTKVVLYYYLENPLLVSLSSLGLTNPIDLVWEEVKFSFVVDWFLPIGNWLSTWDAGLGWRFKSGTRSDVTTVTGRYYYTLKNFRPGWVYTGPMDLGSYRSKNFIRTVYSSQPGVGLPHFKNPFTSTHIAEGLALLSSAFR